MSSVDVIIPCYNYGHFLRECVTSVLTQTGVDVRVLIMDDCSPDNTPEVGKQLAAEDSRVEYRRNAVNLKNIATYNAGLKWAASKYTLILSADDLLLPGSLGRAARLMDTYPEVGFVYGRILLHRAGQPLPESRTTGDDYTWEICDGVTWLERFCKNMGNGVDSPTVVVRTKVQHEVGEFRTDLPHSGDIELWSRFALRGSIGVLDADQAIYRVHGTNMHLNRDHVAVWVLKDRASAFLHAFSGFGNGSAEHRRVEELARQTLAHEALWTACKAFDHGETEKFRVKELMDFATATYDGARSMKVYQGLQRRMRVGPLGWRALRRVAFWKKPPERNRAEIHDGAPGFLGPQHAGGAGAAMAMSA